MVHINAFACIFTPRSTMSQSITLADVIDIELANQIPVFLCTFAQTSIICSLPLPCYATPLVLHHLSNSHIVKIVYQSRVHKTLQFNLLLLAFTDFSFIFSLLYFICGVYILFLNHNPLSPSLHHFRMEGKQEQSLSGEKGTQGEQSPRRYGGGRNYNASFWSDPGKSYFQYNSSLVVSVKFRFVELAILIRENDPCSSDQFQILLKRFRFQFLSGFRFSYISCPRVRFQSI